MKKLLAFILGVGLLISGGFVTLSADAGGYLHLPDIESPE